MPLRPHRRRTASPSSRRDVDGSPNPHRRRSRSPARRESRDRDRRRRSPVRRESRRNRSPVRRERHDGDRRRSSPVRRESRDGDRRRSCSPVRRESHRDGDRPRSRDGDRRRSRSPVRRESRDGDRRRSSRSPIRQILVGDLRRSHSSVRRPAELQWVEKDAKPVLLYWVIASFMGRCEINHLADDFVDCGQKMGFKICPPYLYRENSVVSSLSSYERVKRMWDRILFLDSPDFILCVHDRNLDICEPWEKLLNEHKISTLCTSLCGIDGTDRQNFLESTLLEISKVQAAGRAGAAPGRGVVPPVRR